MRANANADFLLVPGPFLVPPVVLQVLEAPRGLEAPLAPVLPLVPLHLGYPGGPVPPEDQAARLCQGDQERLALL